MHCSAVKRYFNTFQHFKSRKRCSCHIIATCIKHTPVIHQSNANHTPVIHQSYTSHTPVIHLPYMISWSGRWSEKTWRNTQSEVRLSVFINLFITHFLSLQLSALTSFFRFRSRSHKEGHYYIILASYIITYQHRCCCNGPDYIIIIAKPDNLGATQCDSCDAY